MRVWILFGLLIFLVSTCLALGHGTPVDPLPLNRTLQTEAVQQIGAQTGSTIEVQYDPVWGTPTSLTGKLTGPQQGDLTEAAFTFLESRPNLFGLTSPREELVVLKSEKDDLGMTHVRFRRVIEERTVVGAEFYVHFRADGSISDISGHYIPTVEVEVEEAVTAQQARLNAVDAVTFKQVPRTEVPDQVIVPDWEKPGATAAWRVAVAGNSVEYRIVYVDVKTGKVIRVDQKVAQDGPTTGTGRMLNGTTRNIPLYLQGGTYYFLDAARHMATDPGLRLAIDNPVDSTSTGYIQIFDARTTTGSSVYMVGGTGTSYTDASYGAPVNALSYIGQVYEYYWTSHNWNSWNGSGSRINAIVHWDSSLNNAYWNPSLRCMLFGDGDGESFSNLAGAYDVIGHELTHAVTNATADLEYHDQPGALNEGISDMMGSQMDGNWMIGEDVFTPATPGDALRYMDNPPRGDQPDHMDNFMRSPNTEEGDWGGVHGNSGIPNKAFYFFVTATNRTDAGRVIFRALRYYMTPTSDFRACRNAWMRAADDIFGSGSAQTTAASTAWRRVGIGSDGPVVNPDLEVLAYFSETPETTYSWNLPDPTDGSDYLNCHFTPSHPSGRLVNVYFAFADLYTDKDLDVLVWNTATDGGWPAPEAPIHTQQVSNENLVSAIMSNSWLTVSLTGEVRPAGDFNVGFTVHGAVPGVDYVTILSDDGTAGTENRCFFLYNYGGTLYWFPVDYPDPPGVGFPYQFLIGAQVDYGAGVAELVFPNGIGDLRNLPNPFADRTRIEFTLPQPGDVRLEVRDVMGNLVRVLLDGPAGKGLHLVAWDGTTESGLPLPAGTYLTRLTSEGQTEVGRLVKR